MHTFLLRGGSLVRPHLETTWRLSQTPSRSPKNRVPRTSRRQQSSSSEAQSHAKGTGEAKSIDPIPVSNVVAPLPFWQRLGPLTRAGQAYARAQRSRPWATQLASALVIYLCADFGAQEMSKRNKVCGDGEEDVTKHDWARTARSLAIGGAAAIPGYIWFTFLSRSFNYSSRVLSIAVKVAVNQLAFTPLFNVYFFGAHALLSGDTPAEAWRRVCNTVPVSFITSCKLWPAVTAFSFAFIPFEYRSVFSGVIAVGWQTYLSFLNGRAEHIEALRPKEESAAIGHVSSHVERIASPALAVQIVHGLPGGQQAALA